MMDGWNSQFNNSPEGTLALSQDRCRRMDKGSFVNLHSGVEMELGHCNFMRKGPLSEMPIAPMLSYEDPDNVTSERQFIESKINAMESLWPRVLPLGRSSPWSNCQAGDDSLFEIARQIRIQMIRRWNTGFIDLISSPRA